MQDNYIYIGNLPFDADERMIQEALGATAMLGEVKVAMTHVPGEPDRFLGYAFAELGSPEAVTAAIKEGNGRLIGDRACFLDLASSQRELWDRAFAPVS